MSERLIFDTFSAVLLFLVAVLGSWLPLHLSSKGNASHKPGAGGQQRSKVAYHLGNCLSAGVMLSAGFCHLLADSLHSLAFVGRFPMATFLAAVGFLVTLASDQVVHSISHSTSTASPSPPAARHRHQHRDTQDEIDDEEEGGGAHTSSGHPAHSVELASGPQQHGKHRQRYSENTPLLSFQQQDHGTAPLVGAAALVAAAGMPAGQSDGGAGGRYSHASSSSLAEHQQPQLPVSTLAGAHSGGEANGHHHHHNHNHQQRQLSRGHSRSGGGGGGGSGSGGGMAGGPPPLEPEVSGHFDVLLAPGVQRLHFATAVLLAAALCVHSVLEGMALGAQQTMRATQDIMVAIAAHKGLAAYALGSSVVESGADLRRFWTVTLTFSLATPVAIFLGYGLSTVSNGAGSAALSALASGTFLYVAVMEVIPRELSGAHMHDAPLWLRVSKVSMLLLGFGLMSLLAIWA